MLSLLQVTDTACLVALFFILYSLLRPGASSCNSSPPLASTYIPWLGCVLSFTFRRSDLFFENRLRYGPVYKILVAGRYFVIVSTPKTITEMVNMSPKVLLPTEEASFRLLSDLKERLPYVIDLLHRTAYVFVANGLAKRSMGCITISMNKALFELLQRVAETKDGEKQIPLDQFVKPNLFRASTSAFFGTTFIPDMFSDFHTMDKGIYSIMNGMSFFAGESVRARGRMIACLERCVQKAWEDDIDGYVDGLSPIISKSLTELRRGGLTVQEVSRLLVSVLWGFNSNLNQIAMNSLAYLLSDPSTYYHISFGIRACIAKKYPDFETLLFAESDALDDDEFGILDSVVKETLRLSTIATSVREAQCDTHLTDEDGISYFIQKGEYLMADVRSMHHDESLFSRPQSFIADRFINEKKSNKTRGIRIHRPWGGGISICKGREFAHYAVKMFLLQVIYLYDITPGDYVPSIEVNRSVTVTRLRGSPMVRLRKRCL